MSTQLVSGLQIRSSKLLLVLQNTYLPDGSLAIQLPNTTSLPGTYAKSWTYLDVGPGSRLTLIRPAHCLMPAMMGRIVASASLRLSMKSSPRSSPLINVNSTLPYVSKAGLATTFVLARQTCLQTVESRSRCNHDWGITMPHLGYQHRGKECMSCCSCTDDIADLRKTAAVSRLPEAQIAEL